MMLFRRVLLFVGVIFAVATDASLADDAGLAGVSWEVEDELLHLQGVLKSLIVTGTPQPIYRKDLDDNYVAYWEIELNNTEYVIIAASAKTGDHRLNRQGALPSPLMVMSDRAIEHGSQCVRFFMMSPDGVMFCEDDKQDVVASTLDTSFSLPSKNETGDKNLQEYHADIKNHIHLLDDEWKKLALEIEQSLEWASLKVYSANNDERVKGEKDRNEPIFGDKDEVFIEETIAPGQSVVIALGDSSTDAKIRVIPFEDMSVEETELWQSRLCKVVVDLCVGDEEIDKESIRRNEYGLLYLMVEIMGDAKYVSTTLEGREVGFQVEIYMKSGEVVVRRFGLDLSTESRRRKRWGSFSEYDQWSDFDPECGIPLEADDFPDYEEHFVSDGANQCLSGSGAVSWAMVLGYYDRLAHNPVMTYGHSMENYRCGDDGTDGSNSCEAPDTMDDRMEGYVEALRDILNTYCIGNFGATESTDMDNIEPFFQERDGHRIDVETVTADLDLGGFSNYWGFFPHFFPSFTDNVNDIVYNRIHHAQMPVVVGYYLGWHDRFYPLSTFHYGVATRIRRRSRTYRQCTQRGWWGRYTCSDDQTEVDYEMYIHHGDGAYDDRWVNAEVYFAATAFHHD